MIPFARLRVRIAHVAAIGLVAVGWRGAASHGSVDQENSLTSGFSGGSVLNLIEPAGQGFTPAEDNLVGADIVLAGFNDADAADITVNIRQGTIDGSILGTVTQSVAQDLSNQGEYIHFDFPAPISVTPGQLYILEFSSTNDSHGVSWEDLSDYAGGSSIFQGVTSVAQDFIFRTYSGPGLLMGDVDCNGAISSVDALKILRYSAGLSVAQTEPCLDVGQELP